MCLFMTIIGMYLTIMLRFVQMIQISVFCSADLNLSICVLFRD